MSKASDAEADRAGQVDPVDATSVVTHSAARSEADDRDTDQTNDHQVDDSLDGSLDGSLDLTISDLIRENAQLAQHSHWSLKRLQRLDTHEHDYQEFKSSEWLAHDEELHSDFLNALSKQVSAFTNGGGGALIIGVDDHGNVDRGVLTYLKSGTREWLEDVINHSVSPRLKSFNVFEVLIDTSLLEDSRPRAVYVIELPQSSEAPHQARDHRYYLRVAGKSRPMSHVHLEDVLRRNNRPRVDLARLGPYGDIEFESHVDGAPQVFLMLRAFLHNQGKVMARHIGAELTLPRVFISREVRRRMEDLGGVHYTQRPGDVSFFRYHPTPLFPTQEIYAFCVWVMINRDNINALRSGAEISWAVYADDAEPLTGSAPLISFSNVGQAVEWLEY